MLLHCRAPISAQLSSLVQVYESSLLGSELLSRSSEVLRMPSHVEETSE